MLHGQEAVIYRMSIQSMAVVPGRRTGACPPVSQVISSSYVPPRETGPCVRLFLRSASAVAAACRPVCEGACRCVFIAALSGDGLAREGLQEHSCGFISSGECLCVLFLKNSLEHGFHYCICVCGWACATDIWETLFWSSLKSQTGFHGLIMLWPDVRQRVSGKGAGTGVCSVSWAGVTAEQDRLSLPQRPLAFLRRLYWEHIFQF